MLVDINLKILFTTDITIVHSRSVDPQKIAVTN